VIGMDDLLLAYLVSYAASATHGAEDRDRLAEAERLLKERRAEFEAAWLARPIRDRLRQIGPQVAAIRQRIGATERETALLELLLDETFQDELADWLEQLEPERIERARAAVESRMAEVLREAGAGEERLLWFHDQYFTLIGNLVLQDPILAHWRQEQHHARLGEEHRQQAEDHQAIRSGVERLLARDGAAAAQAVGPGSPLQPIPLPQRPSCFGRDEQIEDIIEGFREEARRPILILGSPGIGKSTLALAALHDARAISRFGERRCFVRCDGAQPRRELAAEIARHLGLAPGPAEAEPAVFHFLGAGPTALVLDNAETPWWGEPGPVEDLLMLLAGIPTVALVVTLRGGERPGRVQWRPPTELRPLALAAAREAFLNVAGAQFSGDLTLVQDGGNF